MCSTGDEDRPHPPARTPLGVTACHILDPPTASAKGTASSSAGTAPASSGIPEGRSAGDPHGRGSCVSGERPGLASAPAGTGGAACQFEKRYPAVRPPSAITTAPVT
jgi:hypothetical protein